MSSSFKVNYPGLRKANKKSEGLPNPKEPATVIDEQSSQLLLQPNSGAQAPISAFKQADGFLDTYNVAFNAGNLDYVNLLIMNQTSVSSTKGKSTNGPTRRKANSRTKSSIDPPLPAQSKSASPMRMVNNNKGTIPPVHSFEEHDKPASMRPDDDDEPVMQIDSREIEDETPVLKGDKSGVIYEEDETSRHSKNNGTPKNEDGRSSIYGRFFREDGVVRRSMSLEDLRFEKKTFGNKEKDHNKSTIHHPEDIRSYSIEKSRDESIHMQRGSHNPQLSSPKTDFVANLDYYINYFQKTENMSYRKMKAGQYFRGFAGKSHRSIHKELENSNRELRTLKLQVEKMKWKMDGLMTENKMLTKELKAANGRDEENQQVMQKLQEQVLHYKQRSHHYKVKCINMQDVIGQERLEHDNNLRALKKVLANINLALDQRSSPYKHAGKHGNNGLVDSILAKKDRERMTKSNLREKRHVNDTFDHYATILEPKSYSRSRENRDNSKRQNSALLSHKMSISSTGEDVEEFSSQLSNSYDYENIYEHQDSNYQDPYNDAYQQEIMKDQQIKFLQGRLAELMSSEEVSFSGQTTGLKSTTKSSRGNKSNHKKQASTIDIPSYYIGGGAGARERHERHGSVSRQGNYEQQERSRILKKNYMETPSMHEPTENSFSLHNSD